MPTIRPASSSGHQTWSAGARTAATATGRSSRREPRLEPPSQRVGHRSILCQEARAPRTSRRRACRRPGRPTAPGRRRARASASRSVSAGTVESGARTIQRSVGLEAVLGDERAPAAGRASKPRRKPVAQITCSAPFTSRLDAEAALVRGALERLVPLRARAGTTARRDAAQERGPLAPAAWRGSRRRPRREKSGRGTLSGRRAGSRRRTETTVAPAASAFSHSVAAAIPAPTTATLDGVLVRLVGVHGARIVRELRRHVRARDGPARPGRGGRRRGRRARSRRRRRGRARCARAGRARPSRVRARSSLDVVEELRRRSGGSGRRRSSDERARVERRRAASRTARPGNDGRAGSARRSPSASAAAGSPRPARRQAPAGSGPARRRRRSRPARRRRVPQRRVRDEAGEPAADDRAPLGPRPTSPSPPAAPGRSSAGTRRTRRAGSTSEMNDAGAIMLDVRAELAQLREDRDGDRLRVPAEGRARRAGRSRSRGTGRSRATRSPAGRAAGSAAGRSASRRRRRSAPTRGCPSGSR